MSAVADIGLPSANNAAVGYFVDQKKGEVNELKQLLKNINVERDMKRKRDVIKKVIAYMTLGIDVSRLFTDMIMAIETKDVVIKKMVYLYLCTYANSQPDLAIMCINSLRRECENEDPTVRGLALRSICSLRLESILEYIQLPLHKSLTDVSAYVRKTGVMGILKVYKLSPSMIENNGYLERLHNMLYDADATVVINAIYAIEELQLATGGLVVTQQLLMALLNRIGEFSEWGLNTILGLISKYHPANEDETYAIMNLLDPVLRTANSGAVLATFKCFTSLTAKMPELQPQIYQRAKPPMLTLVTGAHSESQYCMLKHLEVMLRKPAAKGVFDDEYRQFFVRYNEAPHVKHLKVDLLPLITNPGNARDIASELSEYVTDVDAELSKRAIKSIGEIAMRIDGVADEMTMALLQLIDMDSPYVRSQAASVLVNVVRLNPSLNIMVLPYLSRMLKRVDDATARASLVWMIGEYADSIVEAPYMLEQIINNYEEEQSVLIKLQLLTASMKVFFKRPPEMHAMLGRLFACALNETNNQDLHDRALLYYRLLSSNVNTAEAVFKTTPSTEASSTGFAENMASERMNKLFQEFNTLAVVYGMPSDQFIADGYQKFQEEVEVIEYEAPPSVSPSPATTPGPNRVPSSGNLIPGQTSSAEVPAQTYTCASPTPVTPARPVNVHASVNLLDMDDHVLSPAHSVTSQSQPVAPAVGLVECAGRFTPVLFQQLWGQLGESFAGQVCTLGRLPAATSELEAALRTQKIVVMASGPLPPGGPHTGLKLFVYAVGRTRNNAEVNFLAQVVQVNETGGVSATVKTDAAVAGLNPVEIGNLFVSLVVTAL
eukprot:gene13573-15619_t